LGFAVATSAAVGKQLALIIDGEVVSAPVVEESIRHGYVTITVATRRRAPAAWWIRQSRFPPEPTFTSLHRDPIPDV
jgi:SecDF, P1 head subdomain